MSGTSNLFKASDAPVMEMDAVSAYPHSFEIAIDNTYGYPLVKVTDSTGTDHYYMLTRHEGFVLGVPWKINYSMYIVSVFTCQDSTPVILDVQERSK